MLTGDSRKAADYFDGQVGISEVCAVLLPEEKVKQIDRLQSDGWDVCMIGSLSEDIAGTVICYPLNKANGSLVIYE